MCLTVKTQMNFSGVASPSVTSSFKRRSFVADWENYQCEIFGEISNTGTVLYPSTAAFPRQNESASAPQTFLLLSKTLFFAINNVIK
jgi:hypothetical protein